MRAKLARYYGSIAEVESLPTHIALEYWKAIEVLEAREVLMQVNISSLPYMEQSKRKAFIERYESKSNTNDELSKIEVKSFSELAKILGGVGGR